MNRFQLQDLGIATQRLLLLHCQDAFTCSSNCLGGGCAIAAYATHKVLNKLKVQNTLYMGEDRYAGCHCWVQLRVNNLPYVLDATAGQFYCKELHPFENEDLEPDERDVGVVVEPILAYKARPFFATFRFRHTTNDAAIADIMSSSWGDQSPSLYTEAVEEFIDTQVHRFAAVVQRGQVHQAAE